MAFRFVVIAVLFSLGALATPWVDPALLQAIQYEKKARLMAKDGDFKTNPLRVLIHLTDSFDLKKFDQLEINPKERASLISQELKKFTEEKIGRLREKLGKKPIVLETLWITQSAVATAPSETIESLMQFNEIESLVLDTEKEILEKEEMQNPQGGFDWFGKKTTIGWGLEKMNVPKLWKKGITGKGITVAVIDSGANLKHPDLKEHLWVNPGETGFDKGGKSKATNGIDDDQNGYIDDLVGWNFTRQNNTPQDEFGHGSQAAGIVGGDGKNGTKTGVAPEAKIMVLRTCCGSTKSIFETNTLMAMQYAMANGAKVISMSLSEKPSASPNYAKWRKASEVLLAAGVVHVNSAGNKGGGATPFNLGAPASNPPAWFHPKQPNRGTPSSMITVGSVDNRDSVRASSSKGPVTWEKVEGYKDFPWGVNGERQGLIKPDVCAPSEVPSLEMTSDGYTKSFGGTSSATPHVAGVVALLLQAKPKLTVAQVTESLQMSSVKVGGEFTPMCGAGRVDANAAVEYATRKF